MAEADHNNLQTQPQAAASRKGFRYALGGLIAVVAIAGVLYGMMRSGGKETADVSACASSGPLAASLRPLARGEIAALNIAKTPRAAVPVSFDGPDGARRQLADFRGKLLLINLWATWCAPCRAEMPALDRLQAKLGSDRFEVVAVNIDTARLERRKTFLDSVGVKNLTFYSDAKADIFQTLKRAGKVVGLPTTLLVDGRGCELGVMAGPAEWDSPDAVRLIEVALDKRQDAP